MSGTAIAPKNFLWSLLWIHPMERAERFGFPLRNRKYVKLNESLQDLSYKIKTMIWYLLLKF